MEHLGDISRISGRKIQPVHCVTFGSPCQDLSTAGKRAGLAGERSGLFMQAVRIIKEMRENSGGIFPAFAIWENVAGAFSSNGGEDFRAVLEQLAGISEVGVSIPGSEKGKWAKAGFIAGDGWSIAWRTLDAQFWGVPQRRRRIALVVDFGGQRAGEVLFERKGLSGHPEPCIPPWKGIAQNPANCSAGYDRVVEAAGFHGFKSVTASIQHTEEQAAALEAGMPENVICRAQTNTDAETYEELAPTMATCYDGPPIVFESHSQDARYTQQGDTSPACTAQWGTGGNNMPLVVKRKLRWIVRRLTPTKCERLQGYPDGWTDLGDWVDADGKKHKSADRPRYKALGNSIALPQWWWIACKMAQFLPKGAALGSLFDGIGGFPLVWETLHGEGTALWASEIEKFPIAVTNRRFQCKKGKQIREV